ncbi:MAG: hypothetical protein JXB03_07255 [Spirochaetales bacterium]|nr:hypothetical protein [Spirochaetales bacterium]
MPEQNKPSPTRELFAALEGVIETYTARGCPCGFPRFLQIVSIDCMDMNALFACRETEGLIKLLREHDLYDTQIIEADFQTETEYWTCRTCGSRLLWGWSDAVKKIDRQYLKPVVIQASPLGADPAVPIPLFGGFYGEKLPSSRFWLQVSSAEMAQYLTQLR